MSEPKDAFKKFSTNAKKVLISAQRNAQTTGRITGTEHILLALTTMPNTLAHGILKENLVTADQIRLVMNFQQLPLAPQVGVSKELKLALEEAGQLALEFKHNHIDTEHLLWALVSNNTKASDLINQIGVNPNLIKEQIENFFDDLHEIETNQKNPNPFNFELNQSNDEIGNFPFDQQLLPPMKPADKIENFVTDLTKEAQDGKIDPVIGRNQEIERLTQILCRRTKNNPVLVGDPGVGKTAIVEGLAIKIANGEVPAQIANKKLIMLDLALMVAGTMYRGQFEDRVKKVLEEIIKKNDTILFIDEIHSIVGAGSAECSLDLANILKPSLAKGKLRLIGATTYDEYRKFIEKDPALERRLQKISVDEPTIQETIEILSGIKKNYELHHGVKINDEAVKAAAELSARFIQDRFLPDKAIDLIDEAAAAWQISRQNQDLVKIRALEKELAQIIEEKEKQVEEQNYQKAAELRTKELRFKNEIALRQAKIKKDIKDEIGRPEIAKVLSRWVNIPVENLKVDEKHKFVNLAQNLGKKIIGQKQAIEAISSSIGRNKTGISDKRKPIGSFIFLGPTGVGKSELAKVLAEELFGSKNALIKIDMSEFMEKHNISRLVGAPPGYVGYDDAGKLTEKIRQKPYSIVLFDEIEKAHPEVFNLLLQILEDGELTDSRGRKVNFRNTVIILTSNLGMQELNRQAVIGFNIDQKEKNNFWDNFNQTKNELLKKAKEQFSPELINRFDKIVVFEPLGKEQIEQIARLELDKFVERIKEEDIKLEYTEKVVKFIAQQGYEPQYGARPIKMTIAENIEDLLSNKILNNEIRGGSSVKIDVKNSKIALSSLKNYKRGLK